MVFGLLGQPSAGFRAIGMPPCGHGTDPGCF
ncbi:hypothetical protein Ae717Ps2_0506 [Pseudonocardia sp. Ae717_Ps2]|nr:hypothetical protein Ae505Ps2_2412 [Pseudonocardia sp. Ae505_Ps2]OLM29613.1 hypothetical protein Ae717Ps2_0506 [Pseudonocardia sp. Ae717_Ps2]